MKYIILIRNHLLRLHFLSIILIGINFPVHAQDYGFKQTFVFDDRSTNFGSVQQRGKDLIIVGQIGGDSLGLTGFYVLNIDTFGSIKLLNYFRDTTLTDHALVDGVNPIVLKPDGNLVISGTMADRDNLFITEIDSVGNQIMIKEFESNFKALYINRVIELDGFYYCIGHVQTENFDQDVFVQKIDQHGNSVWTKTFGVPSMSEGSRAALVENKGITILSTEGYDPEPLVPNDTKRWTRIMHIDTSGSIKSNWSSELNEDEITSGGFVKIEEDYVYSIWSTNQPTIHTLVLGAQIVRRNSGYEVVWRKNYSEVLGDNGISNFATDSLGILYAVGQVHDYDLWASIWKIDPNNGEIIWLAQDTGISVPNYRSKNYLRGATGLPSGSIIAVGSTQDPNSGHKHGLLIKVTKDGCVDTLCTTSVIEDIITRNHNLMCYPNPANDEVNFYLENISNEDFYEINILDINGVKIASKELVFGENAIAFGNLLPPGMYLWKLTKAKQIIDGGRFIVSE